MLKGLLMFIVIILIVVSIIVLIAVNFVLRLLRRLRKIANGDFEAEKEQERRSTSRHQSQYAFRGGKKAGASQGSQGDGGYQQTYDAEGKVIIDNRRPTERNRKIISDNEGEYVEFTEE